jgi:tetratricopeptide (TPR) repeat protein
MAYQSEIEKLEQRYHENPQQWFAALADCYRKAGDLDLAVEVVRGGLEKRPNYASGHIVLGRCLLDMEKTAEAAAAFQQVLELDAENIIALKSLGDIAEQEGEIAGAKDWLGRLLEIDPMNDEARESLERLGNVVIEEAEAAEAVAEQPSIEPGAAWAAEALADINRGGEESAAGPTEVARQEASDGSQGEVERVEETSLTEPEPSTAGEMSIEKTSWDALHGGSKPEAAPESGTSPEAEIDAAFGQPAAVEPVSGLVAAGDSLDSVREVADTGSAALNAPPGPDPVPEGGEAKMAGDLEVVSFDDELSWGVGDEHSGAISEEDVHEAEVHHEDLAPAVEFLGDPEAFGAKGSEPSPGPVESLEEVLGTEGAEVPQQPETVAEAGNLEPGQDLPLIIPDEVDREQNVASAGGAEPEPVVTETMADVYANQGLFEQARETYEKLLEQRPGDPGLEQKLAEVSGQVEAFSGDRLSRFAVGDTGGQSAVDFLQQVFGSGAAEQAEPAYPVAEGSSEPAEPVQAEPQPESPLESAFGGEPAEPPGAPTIPATDEVSLSSVFGGETPPTKAGSGEPVGSAPAPDGSGVSFDQFYGSDQRPVSADGDSSDADEESDEGADDDFRNWLEGLKT